MSGPRGRAVQRSCAAPGTCGCEHCRMPAKGDDTRRDPDGVASALLRLQRTVGNAAVAGLVQRRARAAVQRDWWDDVSDAASEAVDAVADTASQAYDTASSAASEAYDAASSAAASSVVGPALGLPPAPGSGTGPKVPDQKLGDTPGSRTPADSPGVRESEGPVPDSLVDCALNQLWRMVGEQPAAMMADLMTMGTDDQARFLAEKFGVCVIVKCFPTWLVVEVIDTLYFAGQPQAVANLHHYIEGTGADFPQPMARLLADPGLRSELASRIDGAKPKPGERVELRDPVNQLTYTSQEWKNALGNVDLMAVTILDDAASRAANLTGGGTALVRVELVDPYQWHPLEGRVTQCLHEMFEAMKASGAAEYNAVGTGIAPLSIDASLIPL